MNSKSDRADPEDSLVEKEKTDRGKIKALIELHVACGTPEESIAACIGIPPSILKKEYKRHLDLGLLKANAKVGQALLKKALKGDVTACREWLSRRGGQAWKAQADASQYDLPGLKIEVLPKPRDPERS